MFLYIREQFTVLKLHRQSHYRTVKINLYFKFVHDQSYYIILGQKPQLTDGKGFGIVRSQLLLRLLYTV